MTATDDTREPRWTVLDLRGLRCPDPVLHAKTALRALATGDGLVLECTDPLTVIDVPHFARQTGHRLVDQSRDGSLYIFRLIKSPPAAQPETLSS